VFPAARLGFRLATLEFPKSKDNKILFYQTVNRRTECMSKLSRTFDSLEITIGILEVPEWIVVDYLVAIDVGIFQEITML